MKIAVSFVLMIWLSITHSVILYQYTIIRSCTCDNSIPHLNYGSFIFSFRNRNFLAFWVLKVNYLQALEFEMIWSKNDIRICWIFFSMFKLMIERFQAGFHLQLIRDLWWNICCGHAEKRNRRKEHFTKLRRVSCHFVDSIAIQAGIVHAKLVRCSHLNRMFVSFKDFAAIALF